MDGIKQVYKKQIFAIFAICDTLYPLEVLWF